MWEFWVKSSMTQSLLSVAFIPGCLSSYPEHTQRQPQRNKGGLCKLFKPFIRIAVVLWWILMGATNTCKCHRSKWIPRNDSGNETPLVCSGNNSMKSNSRFPLSYHRYKSISKYRLENGDVFLLLADFFPVDWYAWKLWDPRVWKLFRHSCFIWSISFFSHRKSLIWVFLFFHKTLTLFRHHTKEWLHWSSLASISGFMVIQRPDLNETAIKVSVTAWHWSLQVNCFLCFI